jgi:hypothetical protein
MQRLNFESTQFGSITISDKVYPHDVYLLPDQQIVKRDNVIGTGQTGILPLTQASESWLASKIKQENIVLIRDCTPLVLDKTNGLLKQGERIAGIFHTTC